MADRKAIPKGVSDAVQKEYRHLCAKCGGPSPQLHHIDEDASNSNDPMNLLPLCPNCHLTDMHSPTERMDTRRIRLFRKYKDPAILSSQFQPLFQRMEFLLEIDVPVRGERPIRVILGQAIGDLVNFVQALNMGDYYWKKLSELLQQVRNYSNKLEKDPEPMLAQEYLREMHQQIDQAIALLVEQLRYQPWLVEERARERSTGSR